LSTSNWQNISYCIDLVKKLDPKNILDIGIGFGRWGILFREFLEVWGDSNYKCEWKRNIDGIEIFPEYIKPYHSFFYNNIYIENALSYLTKTTEHYDLINCGDVIEHFNKEDGKELINLCLKKADYTLINIPVGNKWEQGAVNGNEFEKHRSVWKNSEFKVYPNHIIKRFKDIELRDFSVILLSENNINLNKAYGKYFKAKSILKNKMNLQNLVDRIENK